MNLFSRLNMKTKCRTAVKVMENMQPNYYQLYESESVQCISAPAPCALACVLAGGVALPLFYLLIYSCNRETETQIRRKQKVLRVTRPSRLSEISFSASLPAVGRQDVPTSRDLRLALHFFKIIN